MMTLLLKGQNISVLKGVLLFIAHSVGIHALVPEPTISVIAFFL